MPAKRKPYTVYKDIKSEKDPTNPKKMRYRARFTYYDTNGNRKQGLSDWSSSEKRAIQNATAKAQAIVESAALKELEAKKMTVKELATHYLEYIKTRPINDKYRATTQATDYSKANCLVFGSDEAPSRTPSTILHKRVSELTMDDILTWMKKINKTVSTKTNDYLNEITFKKYMTALRKLLKYADTLDCYYSTEDYFKLESATYITGLLDTKIFTESKDRSLRVINEGQFRKMMVSKRFPSGYCRDSDVRPGIDKYKDDLLNEYEQLKNNNPVTIRPSYPFDRAFKNHILLGMFFYSGLRTSEIRPLRWSDINFEYEESDSKQLIPIRASVSVDKAYSYKSIKGKRQEHREKDHFLKNRQSKRTIPLLGWYVQELYLYKTHFEAVFLTASGSTPIDEYISNMLLFPGKDMNSYMTDSPIDRLIENAVKKIDIGTFTKHDFRRSRIKEFLLCGYEPDKVHRFFGHKDSKMITDVYNALQHDEEYMQLVKLLNGKAFGQKEQDEYIRNRLSEFFPE